MEPVRPSDPKTLGDFKIIARLGQGGMGTVFLATRGTQRVALKVVRSNFYDDPTLGTRFQREIDTLKKIQSPFVARFLDSAIEEDFAWHAVEFANGPNLKEQVDHNGPLSEEQWWKLASQLQSALSSIHALGIVHRDIKPSNMILTDSGLKLIDFGISQDSEATSLTTTGMVAGSPAWLAPEQLEGTEISSASDLFSAGSVLVFAATGRSPWGNETSMSVPVVYQKILTGAPNLKDLLPDQALLVQKLLQQEPAARSFTIPSGRGDKGGPDEEETEKKVRTKRKPALTKAGQVLGLGTLAVLGSAFAWTLFIAAEGDSAETDASSPPQSTEVVQSAAKEDKFIDCSAALSLTRLLAAHYIDGSTPQGTIGNLKILSQEMDSLLVSPDGRTTVVSSNHGPEREAKYQLQQLNGSVKGTISAAEKERISPRNSDLANYLRQTPAPERLAALEAACTTN